MISRISFVVLCAAPLVTAQERTIDLERSTITIHVGKAGLFSVAGHEHWVEAPVSSGIIDDSTPERVEFRVEASKMQVKPDPKTDAKTQTEIQKDMQEKVLESARYPQIVFWTSRVEKRAEAQWRVDGALTLHGITKEISLPVTRAGDAYTGHTTIRQTDYGIKPVTAAGGTVKVKNELEIDFRIFARSD